MSRTSREKPTEQEIAHAVDLHRQILALANSEQDLPADEDSLLSFHLAGSLPLDLDFKQKMLSLRSEAQRIQSVITYFEGILPNLRRAVSCATKGGRKWSCPLKETQWLVAIVVPNRQFSGDRLSISLDTKSPTISPGV